MIVHEFNINKELYDVSKAFEAHEKTPTEEKLYIINPPKKNEGIKNCTTVYIPKEKNIQQKEQRLFIVEPQDCESDYKIAIYIDTNVYHVIRQLIEGDIVLINTNVRILEHSIESGFVYGLSVDGRNPDVV